MATIVNTPSSGESSGGMGMFLTAVLVIGLILVVGYFLLPAIRQGGQTNTPSIQIPEEVDININQPTQ
ncbi:MAG: hypothetical protein WC841_05095 [Candidatus Shapirobacteria bacterium]|jgi:hypothetical protein